jgi:hypothetical protein
MRASTARIGRSGPSTRGVSMAGDRARRGRRGAGAVSIESEGGMLRSVGVSPAGGLPLFPLQGRDSLRADRSRRPGDRDVCAIDAGGRHAAGGQACGGRPQPRPSAVAQHRDLPDPVQRTFQAPRRSCRRAATGHVGVRPQHRERYQGGAEGPASDLQLAGPAEVSQPPRTARRVRVTDTEPDEPDTCGNVRLPTLQPASFPVANP